MSNEKFREFTECYMTAMWYGGFTTEVNELLLYLKGKPIPPVSWPSRRIRDPYGDNYPVKMLWSTLVLMFGDFKVSPDTSGQITDVEGAIDFLEDLKEHWGVVESFPK